MIIIRILARLDQPVTILTYQAVGVGVLMIPPTIWFWQMPTAFEWGLLVAIGIISAVAQYLNILAFKAGEASALAPLEYSRLLLPRYWVYGCSTSGPNLKSGWALPSSSSLQCT